MATKKAKDEAVKKVGKAVRKAVHKVSRDVFRHG